MSQKLRMSLFAVSRYHVTRFTWYQSKHRTLTTQTSIDQKSQKIVVKHNEVSRFMMDCMLSVHTDATHAAQLADVLVAADYRGHFSHGLNRLEMYVNDVKKNVCSPSGSPKILAQKAATAWVDGQNLLGPVVGNFCIEIAIEKARDCGIGFVVAKGSNHYGIAAYYSTKALQHGMIGFSATNTSPIMVPTRAKKPMLGTNPLSIAAPGASNDCFVLDMATTGVAIGKVELSDRKGMNIPRGWAVNSRGKETVKPKDVIGIGGLLPLGGTEVTSGYKGYGLGLMVEVLCGILAGGQYGPHVRKWMSADKEADLGQCFLAIDTAGFAPDFSARLQTLMGEIRGAEKADGEHQQVLVPGDPEKQHMQHCDAIGGIPYHENQIAHAEQMAESLGVKSIQISI